MLIAAITFIVIGLFWLGRTLTAIKRAEKYNGISDLLDFLFAEGLVLLLPFYSGPSFFWPLSLIGFGIVLLIQS